MSLHSDTFSCANQSLLFILNDQIKKNISKLEGNRIDGVMVSLLASSAVARGFEPRSGQTKDYEIV
jgi:hypothetical protein